MAQASTRCATPAPPIDSQRELTRVPSRSCSGTVPAIPPPAICALPAPTSPTSSAPWLFGGSIPCRPLARTEALAPLARRCHPSVGRAQDAAPPWEVADIWRRYGQTSGATPPVPPPHQKVRHALLACRTAQLGGQAEQCGPCGFERYAYHACRHRHGPTCQTLTTATWLEARPAALLPVPYCHGVFPLPPALNPLVLTNKRARLTLLVRATSQTRRQCGHHNLGGHLGGLVL